MRTHLVQPLQGSVNGALAKNSVFVQVATYEFVDVRDLR